MKRALIALLLVIAAPTAAWADELDSVVGRYLAWRGGPAFERLRTIESKGRMEIAGLSGTIHYRLGSDGLSRTEADFGVVKALDVIVPDGGFSLNHSGQLEKVSAVAREAARRRMLIEFGDAVRGQGGVRRELLADETLDGKSWDVLRLTFGDGTTWDLFLDPATGAAHGARVVENKIRRFESYEDWRLVDGVRMPFRTSMKSELASSSALIQLDSVTLNGTFAAALFERPAEVRKATFADGATTTGWIDFEFFNNNRIFFPARVNGVDTVVILDSGAESTVFDTRFAEKAGLKPQGAVTAMGTGGTSTAGLIRGVTIKVGNLSLNDLTVASIDLAQIEKAVGHEMPVILGKEIFTQLVVDIDFENRRIAFSDPAGFTPPAGAAQVPITAVDGLRAVPVSIEGRPPALFDFDLGNGTALLIFPSYAAAEKLLEGRPQSTGLGGAVGGIREDRVAVINSLSFAGVTFTGVPTSFPPPGPSAVDSDHTQGNLGLPVLSRFRLITDYPQDRLYLVPGKDAARPFDRDRLGLSLSMTGETFTVRYVARGGPAEAAGFKQGDVLTLVDGKPTSGWTRETLSRLRFDPRAEVSFRMADGLVRTVKLGTFY